MSTSTASTRRPGCSGSKPSPADIAKKSPCTSRVRGSSASSAPPGTRSSRCQRITSSSASTTITDPTRSSPSTVRAVHPSPSPPTTTSTRSGTGREHGQPEGGQRHLGRGEQAGHEVLLTQPHLVDLDPERRLDPPAQHDLAHRRRRPRQLLDPCPHCGTVPTDGCVRRRLPRGSGRTTARAAAPPSRRPPVPAGGAARGRTAPGCPGRPPPRRARRRGRRGWRTDATDR